MSKSLAETVNFAEAVQKKSYEKKAQQVDTFVKSETAEQKLARSGKMQTAKAIEALASLGGTVLEGEAKKREAEVALIQEDLANITAAEIQEQRDGAKPYSSETFSNLPLRFQTRVRQAVGYERGKRLIGEAESSIDNFTLLDDAARVTHIEGYMQELALTDGMSAHELVGYNKGWQEGVDRINNAALKAKTAEGEKKIESDFKGVVAGVVTAEHESFLELEESGALDLATATDAYKIELRNNAAKRTYETIEAKFKSYTNETGINVPPEIKKQWVRESLLEAAKATNNPYLLDPANLPKEYQDETTKYFFADARVALKDKFKSDQRSAVAASNAKRIADRNQADIDAFDGTISFDTPNLTLAQTQALTAHEERGKLTGGASTKNKNSFMLQVQKSIADGSNVLVDMEGNAVKDKHGNEVSLDRASLDEYLLYNPLFLDNEQTYLSNNLGSLLVGIDTAAHFPTKDFNTYLENLPYKVAGNQLPNETLKVTRKAERLFRKMYSEAQRDKGWADPLTSDEIVDIQDEFLDKLEGMNPNPIPTSEVNLDGTTNPNPSTPDPSTPDPLTPDPLTPKVVKEPTQSQLDWFESNKNNPKAVENWEKAGFEIPVPEVSDEELKEAYQAANIEQNELMDILSYLDEANNDPSLTVSKNNKAYKENLDKASKFSPEVLEAATEDYVENALVTLESILPTLAYTIRPQLREYMQQLRENPQAIFNDSEFKRYIEKQ
jgi:hypothetical protein